MDVVVALQRSTEARAAIATSNVPDVQYSTSVAGDKIDCHADEGPSGGWEEASSNYKPEIVSVWIIQCGENVRGLTAPELTIYCITLTATVLAPETVTWD